ncbi:MAG: PKD domain-containing protein [Chitinophagaceae bacterium]|nr:PKD domain-containing protein [Chitinophagaceae bacterium]
MLPSKLTYNLILSVIVCFISVAGFGQSITKAEYFVDNDPGFGNAIPLPPGFLNNTQSFSLDISSLTPGMHQLYVRTFQTQENSPLGDIDAKGGWSLTASKSFYKETIPVSAISMLYAYEYFFDTDPGFGKGTRVLLSPRSRDSLHVPLSIQSLDNGFHSLYMRFQDEYGRWGLTGVKSFYKDKLTTNTGTPSSIIRGEYFFDTDPGFGAATTIPGTSISTNQDLFFSVDIAALSDGFHLLYTRFLNADGHWGHTAVKTFFKNNFSTKDSAKLTALEYFIDSDPGFGNGIPVQISQPAANPGDIIFQVDLDGVPAGNHLLYVRAKDEKNVWSLTNVDTITVQSAIPRKISIDSVASRICAGSSVDIPFKVSNKFSAGNIFKAQLSSSTGQFSAPVEIGTLTSDTSGTIKANIPSSAAYGTGYRIRIVSTNVADTSSISNVLLINRIPDQVLTIGGERELCARTETYSVASAPGVDYRWYVQGVNDYDTSGPGSAVQWVNAGIYTLSVQSGNYCGNGSQASIEVAVFNTPPAIIPSLTNNNGLLSATQASKEQGVTDYQWFRDGGLIANATGSTYATGGTEGAYTVRYVNPCGTGSFSESIIVGGSTGLPQTISFTPVPDKTFGDAAFRLSAAASSGLPVTFTIISGSATISTDTVTIMGAGSITIEASQPGNESYSPAVERLTLNVSKASQVINFTAQPDSVDGRSVYTLAAGASSGLPVSFYVVSGSAKVEGNLLLFIGAGEVKVRAVQNGNSNYLPVFDEKVFCVVPGMPGDLNGMRNVCKGSQRYSVSDIPGATFKWTLSGGGTVSNTSGNNITVNWTEYGTFDLTVTASAQCAPGSEISRSFTIAVSSAIVPGQISGLYPVNDTLIQDFPFLLSWQPSANAQQYDVYIWEDGTAKPAAAAISNLERIGVALYSYQIPGFVAGRKYNWQVHAKNACESVQSSISTFRVPDLPNLVIESVTVRDDLFSGQSTEIGVVVKNIGKAATREKDWRETVWFSTDDTTDRIDDKFLGDKMRVSALQPGESYSTTIPITIPENVSDTYYLIAETNKYRSLPEADFSDNVFVKAININLTPPPDLKVLQVVAKQEAFSGDTIELNYTVANKGTGDTRVNSWMDRIYLSTEEVLDINAAILLGEVMHKGYLQKDDSYDVQCNVTLPRKIFGRHYIHIVTDAKNEVLEFSFETNNTLASEAIAIYLTPPPDFTVNDLIAPARATSGSGMKVDIVVKNEGASAPHRSEKYWYDAVYASRNAVFKREEAILIGSSIQPEALIKDNSLITTGQSYTNSIDITLPAATSGDWYLHAYTDYQDNVFEFNKEDNNVMSRKITLVNPDFIITGVKAPGTVYSGSQVNIEYSIKNKGAGKSLDRHQLDVIRISTTPSFDHNAVQLGSLSFSGAMDTGSVLNKEITVRIPDTLSGLHYLMVETDYNRAQYEEDEANNKSAAIPVQIILSSFPDLKAISIHAAAGNFVADNKLGFSYRVQNAGDTDIVAKSWIDNIYISKSSTWPAGDAYRLKSIEQNRTLLRNDYYDVQDSVEISSLLLRQLNIDSTDCYLFIVSDSRGDIFEYRKEDNNTAVTPPFFVSRPQRADLVMQSVSGTVDSVKAGEQITLEWTVINKGGRTGYYSKYWEDMPLLSSDSIPDNNDRTLTGTIVYGPLQTDSSYTKKVIVTIPNGIQGEFYVLMVADYYNRNDDIDPSDNHKVLSLRVTDDHGDTVEIKKPIQVTLPPSSDLTVSFNAPSIVYAGQPFVIRYKVVNSGVAVTTGSGWTDRVRISLDGSADYGDIIVGENVFKGKLEPGEFYEDSIVVNIPLSAEGNYYLLIKTDDNNIVYEHNGEDNNVATSLLFVQPQLPADLVVSSIETVAEADIKATINVKWTTRNNGENPAIGHVTHIIYASTDTVLDEKDIVLSTVSNSINLAPFNEMQISTNVTLKAPQDGGNHILVRTDGSNNILESDESNNVSSSDSIRVNIPQLPIGTLVNATLVRDEEYYYKIVVPDSLAAETLQVLLTADSTHKNSNELFVKYGSLPSASDADFVFRNPFKANQDIVIPSLQAGTYYVLIKGSSFQPQKPANLLAKIINFEVHTVTSNKGGNTGSVTVKITGAKFENNMQVSITDAIMGTITAHAVTVKNSLELFATFNLSGADTGTYDIRIVKQNSETATLNRSFSVVSGSGGRSTGSNSAPEGFYCTIQNLDADGGLEITPDYPPAVRVNRVFPIVIKYGNSGNVDIPIPTRRLISMTGSPVSFSFNDIVKIIRDLLLEQALTELSLEFQDPDGIGGILRPGAAGTIIIHSAAFNVGELLRFRLLE